jgi:hypothetical protein
MSQGSAFMCKHAPHTERDWAGGLSLHQAAERALLPVHQHASIMILQTVEVNVPCGCTALTGCGARTLCRVAEGSSLCITTVHISLYRLPVLSCFDAWVYSCGR